MHTLGVLAGELEVILAGELWPMYRVTGERSSMFTKGAVAGKLWWLH